MWEHRKYQQAIEYDTLYVEYLNVAVRLSGFFIIWTSLASKKLCTLLCSPFDWIHFDTFRGLVYEKFYFEYNEVVVTKLDWEVIIHKLMNFYFLIWNLCIVKYK